MNTDNEMRSLIKKELRFHKAFMVYMGTCLLINIVLPIYYTIQDGWSWPRLIWLFYITFCLYFLRESYLAHQKAATKLRRNQ